MLDAIVNELKLRIEKTGKLRYVSKHGREYRILDVFNITEHIRPAQFAFVARLTIYPDKIVVIVRADHHLAIEMANPDFLDIIMSKIMQSHEDSIHGTFFRQSKGE